MRVRTWGGGHSGTEWIPTAKWTHRKEEVSQYFGVVRSFFDKTGSGQFQTKKLTEAVAYELYFAFTLFF